MTPYQRGNRDACLELAAWAETAGTQHEARYDAFVGPNERRADQFRYLLHVAHELRNVARHARARAEALPDDPDAPTPAGGTLPHRDAPS